MSKKKKKKDKKEKGEKGHNKYRFGSKIEKR